MQDYKLQPSDIQIINLTPRKAIFFHSSTLQIYPIENEDILNFLMLYKANNYSGTKEYYSKKDFDELYNFICDTIKASPQQEKLTFPDKEEKFDTIILPIAAACNLNCPYCFAQTDGGFHFGNFSTKDIERIASFLIEKKKDRTTPLTIIFFGGEPLINFDVIEFTITHFKEKYPEYKVLYSITTNGTLFTDHIIEVFKKNNVAVLISLDGYENEFNLRKFKNGTTTVEKVVANINLLKHHKINVQIRATLVNNNPYIVQTYNFFEQIGVPFSVAFAYASENKAHHLAEYNSENLFLIKQQFDELLQYYIHKLENKQPILDNLFMDITQILRFRINKDIACAAGLRFFTITSNGNIYSCAHLMNDSKFKIGNISEGVKDKADYIAVPIDEIEECKDCSIRYLCLGSCFSQKISSGKNNRSSKLKYECELERLRWYFYITLYYYAKKLVPEYFNALSK